MSQSEGNAPTCQSPLHIEFSTNNRVGDWDRRGKGFRRLEIVMKKRVEEIATTNFVSQTYQHIYVKKQ